MARLGEDAQPTPARSSAKTRRAPATTPEQRNNQLIALSYDAAEEQIRSGKATSQLLTHFLKQGTARDELERQKLEYEGQLLQARTESINAAEDVKELYQAAIEAMTVYTGGRDD